MNVFQKYQLAKEKGFKYDPSTGHIIGLKGNYILNDSGIGYIKCFFRSNGVKHEVLAHRLVWFLYYGKMPKNQIDHIDGNRRNNKIENLRDVTNKENHWNLTKAKGYTWNKAAKKFHAKIVANGKPTYLGCFKTEKEARMAYLEGKKKHHIIPNHHETINHDI